MIRQHAATQVVILGAGLDARAWRMPELGGATISDPHAGEPWRSLWAPPRMRSMLNGHGFDVVSDHDLLALAGGLPLSPDANGSLRNGRVAVAAHP